MASLTDYKFVYIKRLGDGSTEALVRFYEGDITTEDEPDPDTGKMVPVARYRRSLMLREEIFRYRTTKTDDEVRGEMDTELAKDITRTPIDEQRVIASP